MAIVHGKIDTPLTRVLTIIVPLLFLLFVISRSSARDSIPVQLGDRMDLRGDTIISLRLFEQRHLQRIDIQEDGSVYASVDPFDRSKDHVIIIHLEPSDKRAITDFRDQWCRGEVVVAPPRLKAGVSDVAVRCGGYDVKQAQVPLDRLPAALALVRKHVAGNVAH